ncbi:hypothetical protein TWF506_005527 [Arthrobotrys conoides]|uniref:Uncharacterized protein n=1 Tax=Arthrobotrys conoides TaxID=74498 RepID=A0AAN8S045_9PEZI
MVSRLKKWGKKGKKGEKVLSAIAAGKKRKAEERRLIVPRILPPRAAKRQKTSNV